jgi:RNA polymerase sigma factor (sigma-70 family)
LCVSRALVLKELVHVGNAGFLEGVKRFDPRRGVKLTTYAKWSAIGAMLKHVREVLPRRSSAHISLDYPTKDDKTERPLAFANHLPANSPNPENLTVAKLTVQSLLPVLDARERVIVESFFGLNGPELSLQEIGPLIQRTPERAGQILHKALGKLRRAG